MSRPAATWPTTSRGEDVTIDRPELGRLIVPARSLWV